MLTIRYIRAFFFMLSIVCGYYVGTYFQHYSDIASLFGLGIGAIFAVSLMFVEAKMRNVSLRNLSAGVFGLIFGFFIAWMLTLIVKIVPMNDLYYNIAQIVFTLVFCYLGMVIAIKGKDEFNLIIPYVRFSPQDQGSQIFLIDTSVIIDGRINGICESGFLSGKLLVPRFVLQELQNIADHTDETKRIRGRRGLDVLNQMRKITGVEVIVHDENFPDTPEVDAKLLKLARVIGCKVLTNDYNLNKIAKLEGVTVLNINELANAMRIVISPGDKMLAAIRKEGKERNQGVAFLDDGTMIVVDNARKFIGKDVPVNVTSVLQTSAGRMIFAELSDRNGRTEQPVKGPEEQRRESTQPRERRFEEKRPKEEGQRPREEGQRPREEGQRPRTDDGQKRSEEHRQRSEENRQRSEENRRRHEEHRRRQEEHRRRIEEQRMKAQEHQPKTDEVPSDVLPGEIVEGPDVKSENLRGDEAKNEG
ncbi:MAG: PIN domain nuclease [Candidatus Omnitrophica bacterium]|nr:PIN domain nuclease [Candidatus Omnitrophota bacterium]